MKEESLLVFALDFIENECRGLSDFVLYEFARFLTQLVLGLLLDEADFGIEFLGVEGKTPLEGLLSEVGVPNFVDIQIEVLQEILLCIFLGLINFSKKSLHDRLVVLLNLGEKCLQIGEVFLVVQRNSPQNLLFLGT